MLAPTPPAPTTTPASPVPAGDDFAAMLAAARAEALRMLCALLNGPLEAPAVARERRLAATAILRIKEPPLTDVAPTRSASTAHAAHAAPHSAVALPAAVAEPAEQIAQSGSEASHAALVPAPAALAAVAARKAPPVPLRRAPLPTAGGTGGVVGIPPPPSTASPTLRAMAKAAQQRPRASRTRVGAA